MNQNCLVLVVSVHQSGDRDERHARHVCVGMRCQRELSRTLVRGANERGSEEGTSRMCMHEYIKMYMLCCITDVCHHHWVILFRFTWMFLCSVPVKWPSHIIGFLVAGSP